MPNSQVHLLDAGTERYGDALLCTVGDRIILIDGGHGRSSHASADFVPLQDQIAGILDRGLPVEVDLIVVSHSHMDHIGCLPELVGEYITSRWAYVPAVELSWPTAVEGTSWDVAAVAGLREEDLRGYSEEALEVALAEAAGLKVRYQRMLDTFAETGSNVIFHGDDVKHLVADLDDVGLEILGPGREHLELARDRLASISVEMVEPAQRWGYFTGPSEIENPQAARYRQMLTTADTNELVEMQRRAGAAVNAQSCVMTLGAAEQRLLFAGDMQFADPDVGEELKARVEALWARVVERGPYAFAKLSHHGSNNANPAGFIDQLGTADTVFGICTGSDSHDHPDHTILEQLAAADATWVRTDRNGLSSISIGGEPQPRVSKGRVNDPTPNT